MVLRFRKWCIRLGSKTFIWVGVVVIASLFPLLDWIDQQSFIIKQTYNRFVLQFGVEAKITKSLLLVSVIFLQGCVALYGSTSTTSKCLFGKKEFRSYFLYAEVALTWHFTSKIFFLTFWLERALGSRWISQKTNFLFTYHTYHLKVISLYIKNK